MLTCSTLMDKALATDARIDSIHGLSRGAWAITVLSMFPIA